MNTVFQRTVDSAKSEWKYLLLSTVTSWAAMTFGESLRTYDEGENNRSPRPVVVVRDQAPGEYIAPKSRLFEALTQFCDDHKGLSVIAIRDDSSIPGGVAIHTQEKKGSGPLARVVILNSSDSRDGVTATYPLGEDRILAVVETRSR